MKIIIMTDLEGVSGVVNAKDYIHADSRYYEHACELATLEVSAAAEGAFQAGATEVLVVDGHGPGAMKRALLHPRAKLLTGRPWIPGYPWGLDGSFAAAMTVGQHAKSNTDGGHLCHTGSFASEEETINDLSIGEFGAWVLEAGYFNVPVVMAAGDQAFCDEARALIPNIETAAVKCGITRGSASGLTAEENEVFNCVAIHLSPDEARRLIRESAYRAVKRIPEFVPFRMPGPYTFTVKVRPKERGGKILIGSSRSNDVLDMVIQGRVAAYMNARQSSEVQPAKPPKKTVAKPAAKVSPKASSKPAARPVAKATAKAKPKARR